MPAVSKAQQRFMGMVHAADKGETPASPEVAKVSASMKDSDAKDFASTKHKGLPDHVREAIKEIVRGVIRENSDTISEMSPNDVHFRHIIGMFDKGGSFTKKKVAAVVTKNPNSNRNKIIDYLQDMDYSEITDVEDELGIHESIAEGKKRFKQQNNVGSSKYTISYHDGVKKHNDGSDFFDIQIFRNQKDLNTFKQALLKKGFIEESVNEGLSKDAVVRTLTSDKNAYFLTKDGNGWILDITPKAAQQSTFHQKFDVKDLGKGHLGMKYKLSESLNEEHDCGCNENHDCGCGGLHEHSHINEDIKTDINKFLDKLNKEFPEQEYSTDFKGGKYARIVQQSRKYSGNRSAWGFVSMEDNPSKGFKKGDLLKAAGFNTPAKGARGNILDGTARYGKWSPEYLK